MAIRTKTKTALLACIGEQCIGRSPADAAKQLLKDLAIALDAMPEKSLAAESLVTADGEFCTLGVLGAARGIDLTSLDPEDPEQVAKVFGIAESMAREIVFENDERDDDYEWVEFELCGPLPRWQNEWNHRVRQKRASLADGPQRRWARMRKWVAAQITPKTEAPTIAETK